MFRPCLVPAATLGLTACSAPVQYSPLLERLENEGSYSYSGTGLLVRTTYPVRAIAGSTGHSTEPVASPFKLTLSKDAAGEVSATLLFDGETYELDTVLPKGEGLWNDPDEGPDVTVFTFEGLFNEEASTKYVAAIYADLADTPAHYYESNFFVIGDQTISEHIPTDGSASYDGRFYLNANAEDMSVDSRSQGDITLDATFGTEAATISGQLRNDYSHSDQLFQVLFIDEADVASDGTYATTLTLDETTCADISCRPITSSELSGAFYGPQADEVGGLFQFTSSTEDDIPIYATGFFSGTQE